MTLARGRARWPGARRLRPRLPSRARGPRRPGRAPLAGRPRPARVAPAVAPSCPPCRPGPGPLALRVVYPPPDAVLQVRDSSFLFGTAGTRRRRVTIDGQPARVWPNGAWLAYVALPADSVMPLRIEARTRRPTSLVYPVRRRVPDAGRVTVGAVWLDYPVARADGRLWLARGEYLTLGVRASRRRRGPAPARDGTIVPLRPQPQPAGGAGRGARVRAGHDAASNAGRPGPLRGLAARARRSAPIPGPMLAGLAVRGAVALARDIGTSGHRATGARCLWAASRRSWRVPPVPAGRCRWRCSTRLPRRRPSSTTTRPAPAPPTA